MNLNHTYIFRRLPILDGRVLSSKYSIYQAIMSMLRESGYTFDLMSRPVPPILRNYQYIERFVLVKLFKNLYDVISTCPFESFKDLPIISSGFAFTTFDSRCLVVDESADNYKRHFLLSQGDEILIHHQL